MVICTHGIIKKAQKTPRGEIEKAERLRNKYIGSLKKAQTLFN